VADLTTPMPSGGSRRGLSAFGVVVGTILALVGLAVGILFLIDKSAAPNLLANIQELLGNAAEAQALRRGGGDQTLAKLLLAAIALAVGVGGIWLFYAGLNAIVERLGAHWRRRILPWVFVGPALALLAVYLVLPAVLTIITSLTEAAGIGNYGWALSDPYMLGVFRNNIIWLVVGTGGAVGLGLLIAALFDRVRLESTAKTFIFLPAAISLVGASVIWRFIYVWRPEGQPQYGLLNAIWTAFGFDPVPWLQTPPINTFAMIVILIWLQTGFCMVILSAAIKGVSVEITEAARLDGASERQLFVKVIVPSIRGSLLTVTITTAIVVLKVFDIVYVLSGHLFNADVIANQMFLQLFQYGNHGLAATLAVLLFLAVLPLVVLNMRNVQQRGLVT
jgi:alpha-glucoside transport system permease protein